MRRNRLGRVISGNTIGRTLDKVQIGALLKQIRVYDFYSAELTDSEVIEAAIASVAETTPKKLIFDTKQWNIDRAILLPSNTHVVIDGVKIKQNDYVFDNVIRGANLSISETEADGYPDDISELHNISIKGFNGAIIEGPDVNATKTHPVLGDQLAVGDYWGWRTLQISLSLTSNITISGIEFAKTRCWAVSFDKCIYGNIYDLNITSTVSNGDCIDIRSGCSNFTIRNINGSTSDDVIALTAIDFAYEEMYPVGNYVYPMEPSAFMDSQYDIFSLAISNVSVSQVASISERRLVALRSDGGRKLYDIAINDIEQTGSASTEPQSVVLIDGGNYGSGYNNNDIYNVGISNVIGYDVKYVIEIPIKVENVTIGNVVQNDIVQDKYAIADFAGITITDQTDYISIYNFDEESGIIAVDSYGDNDGTFNDVTLNQAGKINKCISLNGTTSYVDVPDVFYTHEGSIGTWFYIDDLTNNVYILTASYGSTAYRFTAMILSSGHASAPGKLEVIVHNNSGTQLGFRSQTIFTTGQWYHAVISMSPQGTRLFINGLQETPTFTYGSATKVAWLNKVPLPQETFIGRFKYLGAYYVTSPVRFEQFFIKNGAIDLEEAERIFNDDNGIPSLT